MGVSRRNQLRLLGSLTAALAAQALCASPAQAQGRDELLQSAQRARSAGEHAQALEFALSANAIRRSSSLYRFIAEERLELSQKPEAYVAAEKCVRLASVEPTSENRDVVLAGCRFILERVRGDLALVTLLPPAPAPVELSVELTPALPLEDSTTVWVARPGPISIRAQAPGFRQFTHTLKAKGGQAIEVPVSLTPLAPAPAEERPQSPKRQPKHASVGNQPAPPGDATSSTSLLGPALVGAGVLALGAGGYLRLAADSDYDQLKRDCPRAGACDDAGARRSSIEKQDRAALVLFIGGGVLAAGGALLWVFDSGSARSTAVSLGPRGVSLAQVF